MRIAIIACDTFKMELEHLTAGDPDFVHREYLEFGLHEFPQDLKAKVIERVNAMEGIADAVLLGYGTCQSLADIERSVRVPTVRFVGDDCVGVYLTQPEYDKERKKCAGTFYATPYFSKMGTEYFTGKWKDQMGDMGQEIDPMYILKIMFAGYSRNLYVHTIGDREYFEGLAKRFAEQLDLRYESRDGCLTVIEDAIKKIKEIAAKAVMEGCPIGTSIHPSSSLKI